MYKRQALGSTETILPYTREYLGIILLGAPYMTAQLVLNNQLRFQGNAFFSMIGITFGGLLNIFLDPLFIFVFHMGVGGAAAATILSQFISFILLLIGQRVSRCIPLRISSIKNLGQNLKIIAGGGLPSLFPVSYTHLSRLICLLFSKRMEPIGLEPMTLCL